MGLANKLSSGHRATVAEGISTRELEYFKASEICFEDGDPIVLRGFFTQSGKYGKSLTLVTQTKGINVPSRYVEMFENLTDEEVESIKAGKLGIKSIKEADSKNGRTVNIEFVDL